MGTARDKPLATAATAVGAVAAGVWTSTTSPRGARGR